MEDFSMGRLFLLGNKANLFVNLAQGLFGNVGGLLGAVTIDILQISLILQQALAFLPDGTQVLNDRIAHHRLELAVATAGKFGFNFFKALAGDSRISAAINAG